MAVGKTRRECLCALLVVVSLLSGSLGQIASIIEGPQNTTAPLGSNATFTCRVVGDNIQWQAMSIGVVEGGILDLRGIFVTELQTSGDETSSVLTVLASEQNNNIPIQCIASVGGTADTASSDVVRLTVLGLSQDVCSPQNTVNFTSSDFTTLDEETVCFQCFFGSSLSSDPATTWRFINGSLIPPDQGEVVDGVLRIFDTTATFSSTKPEILQCRLGGEEYTLTLLISAFESPEIEDTMGNPIATITLNEGDTLDIFCDFSNSAPRPDVRWLGPQGNMITSSVELVIVNIQVDQAGVYTCQVENDGGDTRNSTVIVTVQSTPTPTTMEPPTPTPTSALPAPTPTSALPAPTPTSALPTPTPTTATTEPPTVPVVDCGSLTDPENGQVTLTGTTEGSTATYSCDTGFILMGVSMRTCQSDGMWSDQPPVCIPLTTTPTTTSTATTEPPTMPVLPIAVSLELSSFNISESGGSLVVCIISGPLTSNLPQELVNTTFTAFVTTGSPSDSATAGLDYVITSANITFPSDTMLLQCISIFIINDSIPEDDEMFTILLSAPDELQVFIPFANVTIIDDDEVATGCVDAGSMDCCAIGPCFVPGGNCFCDFACFSFNDCCPDIEETCPPATPRM